MECNACGAPLSEGSLICEFCGVAQKTITDPADEVRAIQELSSAWSRMGQKNAKKAGGSLLAAAHGKNNPTAIIQRTKAFWGSAYMPTTTEGLFAAAEQAAMLIADANFGDMQAATLNPIMLSRMDNCIELLEVKAPGDPRLPGMQRLLEKKKAENKGVLKKIGMCFPISTRFLTPYGFKALADLDRGDEVLSVAPDGGLVTERVSRRVSYGSSPILRLECDGKVLRTTGHHSLRTALGWLRAEQLKEGDSLVCVNENGEQELKRVLAIQAETAEPVFNLHTTGPHTAIAEGVLTHNFTNFRLLRTLWHRIAVDPWLEKMNGEISAT